MNKQTQLPTLDDSQLAEIIGGSNDPQPWFQRPQVSTEPQPWPPRIATEPQPW